MTNTQTQQRWTGILAALPGGGKVMLTIFLAIIGSGYLVAVANIFYSHQMADGKEGVTLDDLRAVYSGMEVLAEEKEIPSRMLTMVRGEMRQYFSSDANFAVLETWLKDGGKKEALDKGESKKTPNRVILIDCMRCHAQSTATEVSKESPFGPDEFTVEYDMISRYVTPKKKDAAGMVQTPPQYTVPRLILVSHQHMLAIPVFTLLVGLMFLTTRMPPGLKGVLTPLPMLAVLLDFVGWWAARSMEPFVLVIAAAGGLFGITFGIQLIWVVIDMWRPPTPRSE